MGVFSKKKKIIDKSLVMKEGEKYDPSLVKEGLAKLLKSSSGAFDLFKSIGNIVFANKESILGKPLQKPKGYKVIKMLGEGSFGQVYLVEKAGHKPPAEYAMKCQDKKKIVQEKMQKLILNEMLVMQHLNKAPHAMHLVEAMEDKETVYFMLELCSGGDVLKAIVRHFNKTGLFTERDAADMVRDMLTSVKEAHDLGVIHRDIKPENFVYSVGRDGQATMKLGDFGLAAFLPPGKTLQDGCGTPNFIAPEVWRGQKYDFKLDVWSLGVCLAVMLTGSFPYDGADLDEIAKAANTPINFGILPWTALSDSLVDLIRSMLEINPEQRITLADALKHKWVVPGGAPDKKMDLSLKNAIADYAKTNDLTKAACTILALNATDAELEQLRKNFEEIDVNKDGTLTLEELRDAFAKHRIAGIGEETLEEMFKAMDRNNDGSVDFNEFVSGAMSLRMQTDERRVLEAFRLMDEDGDGQLSQRELVKALRRADLPAFAVQKILEEVDADGDGLISFEEFRSFWMSGKVQAHTDSASQSSLA